MDFFRRILHAGIAVGVALAATSGLAVASPSLVIDADSGDVLYQDKATDPWFPASTTKLMTVYVALSAVREGRITLDTPLMVSARAAVMPPSKMGFRPGTLVTLDNALKMLMVKSPNDIAVTVAEGVSGSVEAFADDMNVYATRIGLHESHFVNPNGLPDEHHMSSARDMAMIARALLHDFPEERGLFGIGVLAYGGKLINNHNGLLGRYPGVDGMKTGFTCAAGYNVVATAEENGHHLITVIMGAPSTAERDLRAAVLFDRFLPGGGQSVGKVDSLPSSDVISPSDNHETACGRGRRVAVEEAEEDDTSLAQGTSPGTPSAGRPPTRLSPVRAAFTPVRVFIGPVPGWTGRVAQAIGGSAKELIPAPTPTPIPSAVSEVYGRAGQQASATDSASAGPVESPLALVGATPVAPAALATGRLVKSTKTLSLATGPSRRRGARKAVASAEATPAATAHAHRKPAVHKAAAAPPKKSGKRATATARS